MDLFTIATFIGNTWQKRIVLAIVLHLMLYKEDIKTVIKEKSFKNVQGWRMI